MFDLRNLWSLVEARAEATPDLLLVVDEQGRTLTFGEYRERAERCCAVVICADAAEPMQFSEMVEFCRSAGLSNQKIPEQLEVVSELPRNASGKILKYQLRERYADAT